MSALEIILLGSACFAAGVINAVAGGGSLLTVPLITILGDTDGLVANGTNRIGVLTQNLASIGGYFQAGVSGLRRALPVLVPTLVGSIVGAVVASRLSTEQFELVFGVIMVPVLLISLYKPKAAAAQPAQPADGQHTDGQPDQSELSNRAIAWPRWVVVVVFAAVGLYGGAFQAGVGLLLVLGLSRAGLDLVNANAIKVVVIAALTAVAVPVFIASNQVHWGLAGLVAATFGAGGFVGAHLGVKGGERLIRPVMTVAVIALAGRMLGFY